MSELTAEMIQQGRGATQQVVAQRRRLAHDVRTARQKLTSSIGLERAFDYELVRLFAQYRLGATFPLLVLALTVTAASTLWLSLHEAGFWLAAILSSMISMIALTRAFLREDPEKTELRRWRRRFVIGELMHGLTWALGVQVLMPLPNPGIQSFVLFVVLMAQALVSTLSATIPGAVYAGLFPLAATMMAAAFHARDLNESLLAIMSGGGSLFFALLGQHLHRTALAAIRSRAEKDAIFVELEEAKINSDEARRRAEEANLAKSRFLATMSHELRTPLNAILGFSEVMKNEIFGPHSSPHYGEYSADIHGSGQHLLTLINEILDLSRIEAGRYELNEEALQLAHMVDDCRHMLNLRAKAKRQVIREQIDPQLPRLWADERAVRQIVLNLLNNAIKFTPPGGEISLKVGWTSTGGQYFSIRDTGPGIPEDEIPVVMSSFGRGSLAIKTAEQGSGLGLPIVKGLIELHGGGFRLTSKPREGTEVIVTFPAARVIDPLPAMEVDAPSPAPAPGQRSPSAHAA